MKNSKCGCTESTLCPEAKKLWNMSSFKQRTKYSNHRQKALVEIFGSEFKVVSFRALNRNNETGKRIKFKDL